VDYHNIDNSGVYPNITFSLVFLLQQKWDGE